MDSGVTREGALGARAPPRYVQQKFLCTLLQEEHCDGARRHGDAPHATGQSVFTYLCTPCYETADVCYDVISVSSVVIVCTWVSL
jgi:hypothetical protein